MGAQIIELKRDESGRLVPIGHVFNQGIPLRLYIATQLMATNYVNTDSAYARASHALNVADTLILAHNETEEN